MQDTTIITSSKLGQRLEKLTETDKVAYLVFDNKRITLVTKITIGRSPDNDVVIDCKLASRHHAMIQKIKDAFFLKDTASTNGTFLNGIKIPADKYVKLNPNDKITIGTTNLVIT